MTKEQLEREQQIAAEIRANMEESRRTGKPLDLTPARPQEVKTEEHKFDAYWIAPEAEDPETGFMTECEFPHEATQWTLYGVEKGELPEKLKLIRHSNRPKLSFRDEAALAKKRWTTFPLSRTVGRRAKSRNATPSGSASLANSPRQSRT
jgi:hypothetical protein